MKLVRLLAWGGAIAALGAMVHWAIARGRKQIADDHLDSALDDSFPASDPTATQDFAIPVNRV